MADFPCLNTFKWRGKHTIYRLRPFFDVDTFELSTIENPSNDQGGGDGDGGGVLSS